MSSTMASTSNLYPEVVYMDHPTSKFGGNVDGICEEIHAATEGWGADEERLLKAMGNTTAEERFQLSKRYKEMFDKDLVQVIKSEVRGDLAMVLKLLAVGPAEADAILIKNAMDGIGTHEKWLYPVLCGRSNRDIQLIKKAFHDLYDRDITHSLNSEIGGDLQKLIVTSLQAMEEEFDPDVHTVQKAITDADAFFEAGEAEFFGTDEDSIFKLICASPPQHLAAINTAYFIKHDRTLMEACNREFSGVAEQAALFSLGRKLQPNETIAKLIRSATRGFGTDEELLAATIVRYQPFLRQIQMVHKKMYDGTSIQTVIKDETKRNFQTVLLTVIDRVCPDCS